MSWMITGPRSPPMTPATTPTTTPLRRMKRFVLRDGLEDIVIESPIPTPIKSTSRLDLELDLAQIMNTAPHPCGHGAITRRVKTAPPALDAKKPAVKAKKTLKGTTFAGKVHKGTKAEKPLSMTTKCIHSRGYHHARARALAEGKSKEEATAIARVAGKKAVNDHLEGVDIN